MNSALPAKRIFSRDGTGESRHSDLPAKRGCSFKFGSAIAHQCHADGDNDDELTALEEQYLKDLEKYWEEHFQ